MKRPPRFLLVLALLAAAAGLASAWVSPAQAAQRSARPPQQPAGCLSSAAPGVHRAGLVVTFADGDSRSFCIEFTEESISGIELLRRSGLELVTSTSGALGEGVCRIDDVGCADPGDCFCRCRGGRCEYWAYYQYAGGAWRVSGVGASTRQVRDGDIDGWSWGSGGAGAAGQPDAPADSLCREEAPSPTPPPPPARRPPSPTAAGRQTGPRRVQAPAVDATATAKRALDPPQAGGATSWSAAGPTLTASITPGQPNPSTPTPAAAVRGRSVRADPARNATEADGGESGVPTQLALFGAVGAGLLGLATFVWYRRSRAGG